MPNLKDIKTRIGSVKKTKQITSAMKLVAAAKLKGATDRALAAQPYQNKLREVLGRIASGFGDAMGEAVVTELPLLRVPASTEKVLLVVLTSDRGLCGGFNNNLMRQVLPWLDEKAEAGVDVTVRMYGRKGRDFAKAKKAPVHDVTIDYAKTPRMELIRPLSDHMVAGFTDGSYDEVWIAYNIFENAASQKPTFSQILPLALDAADLADEVPAGSNDYLFEPDPLSLAATLLPLYLRTLLLQAFLETEAGEFGARMLAMDNATRNASELIDALTLQYNRARQAAITTEITEIVSGAEAL